MKTFWGALKGAAKSPAVQKEFVVLVRLLAVTLAAKYGLDAKF